LEWNVTLLFERLGINCVLDVGANHGQHARFLRESGYRGDIVSFEPVPEVFDPMRTAMAGDTRWHGFPWALGDSDDEAEINVADGDAQASSFLSFKKDGPARCGDAHRVVRSVQTELAVHHFYEGMMSLGDALNRNRDLGFTISGVWPLYRELDELGVIELDCVMVRPDGAARLPPSDGS
jgi:FkbM family methyltransferase